MSNFGTKIRLTYDNGTVYEGNAQPHGLGIISYAEGDVYNGEWKNGKIEGRGRVRFANGDVYNGEWKNGMREGRGIMRKVNGDIYIGDWRNGMREGTGIKRKPNGAVYEGQWNNNVIQGQGRMTYANGAVYEGQWNNNVIQGQGRMTYANGTVYEGRWENGEIVQVPRPGVAFEIHNASDKINVGKYYELLQIDVPDEHYETIDMPEYIKGQFGNIIREKMPEKEATLNAILTKATDLINANKVFVGRTIDYVMKQPDTFKELYIASFIIDCSQAYEGEHQMSCNKGILERINMSLIPPLTDCNETTEDCIKYKNLLRLLTQSINIQDIIQEWSENPDIKGMSAQERKKNLIAFITSKYVELGISPPTTTIQANADELDYVYKTLQWGGKNKYTTKRKMKKNKTKRKIKIPKKYTTKRKMMKRKINKHKTTKKHKKGGGIFDNLFQSSKVKKCHSFCKNDYVKNVNHGFKDYNADRQKYIYDDCVKLYCNDDCIANYKKNLNITDPNNEYLKKHVNRLKDNFMTDIDPKYKSFDKYKETLMKKGAFSSCLSSNKNYYDAFKPTKI